MCVPLYKSIALKDYSFQIPSNKDSDSLLNLGRKLGSSKLLRLLGVNVNTLMIWDQSKEILYSVGLSSLAHEFIK